MRDGRVPTVESVADGVLAHDALRAEIIRRLVILYREEVEQADRDWKERLESYRGPVAGWKLPGGIGEARPVLVPDLYQEIRGTVAEDPAPVSPRAPRPAAALPPPVLNRRASEAVAEGRLQRREMETLLWLMRGLMDKEIAAAMGISERTVNGNLRSIYAALGVHDRREAARYARVYGWGEIRSSPKRAA